jgi:hypothetical protein
LIPATLSVAKWEEDEDLIEPEDDVDLSYGSYLRSMLTSQSNASILTFMFRRVLISDFLFSRDAFLFNDTTIPGQALLTMTTTTTLV